MTKNITKLALLMGLTGLQAIEIIPNGGDNPEIQQLQEQEILSIEGLTDKEIKKEILRQSQILYRKCFNLHYTYLELLSNPSGSGNYFNVLANSIVEMIDFSKYDPVQNLSMILENIDEFHRNIIASNPKRSRTLSYFIKNIMKFYIKEILSYKTKDEDEGFIVVLNLIIHKIRIHGTLTKSFKADIDITTNPTTDSYFNVEFNNKELEKFFNEEDKKNLKFS